MDALFRYLVRYEVPIYIIFGLGVVFAIHSVWLAWSEWRKAVFGLEKEIAYQRLRTRTAVAILLIILILSQFCMVTFVVPYLPSITFSMTATPNLFGNNNLTGASATLPETTAPEAASTLPAPIENNNCAANATITSLAPRQEISGRISLFGTASAPNFGFYKYEYRQLGDENWMTIAAGREIVTDGELGSWDTSNLLPGDYEIRLVVTDNENNQLPACVIPVRILEP
jgi:hypothetical protein